jgi:Zn-dependent peptidase ImmA (M78 family)
MIYYSPDIVLKELGITNPDEIDIEAIAYYCGAIIKYRNLDGCIARIVGNDKKAIISICDSGNVGRNRFSAAHELGHWANHRGTQFLQCQPKDIFSFNEDKSPETIANIYAADLLMPQTLFQPRAQNRELTLSTASELAAEFNVSLTATAIRLLKFGSYPGMLVCYDNQLNRKWYSKTHDVPYELMPVKTLHHETQTFDVLFNKISSPKPVKVNSSLWIQHMTSYKYSIIEQSIKTTDDLIIVMLWWKDESQLIELKNDLS